MAKSSRSLSTTPTTNMTRYVRDGERLVHKDRLLCERLEMHYTKSKSGAHYLYHLRLKPLVALAPPEPLAQSILQGTLFSCKAAYSGSITSLGFVSFLYAQDKNKKRLRVSEALLRSAHLVYVNPCEVAIKHALNNGPFISITPRHEVVSCSPSHLRSVTLSLRWLYCWIAVRSIHLVVLGDSYRPARVSHSRERSS